MRGIPFGTTTTTLGLLERNEMQSSNHHVMHSDGLLPSSRQTANNENVLRSGLPEGQLTIGR